MLPASRWSLPVNSTGTLLDYYPNVGVEVKSIDNAFKEYLISEHVVYVIAMETN